jgi:hypothetical protein
MKLEFSRQIFPIPHISNLKKITPVDFFIIKPNRCTNFTNLLWHETLHVSASSSAHHQEFIHCTLGTGIYHIGFKRAFEQDQDGTGSILVLLKRSLKATIFQNNVMNIF